MDSWKNLELQQKVSKIFNTHFYSPFCEKNLVKSLNFRDLSGFPCSRPTGIFPDAPWVHRFGPPGPGGGIVQLQAEKMGPDKFNDL